MALQVLVHMNSVFFFLNCELQTILLCKSLQRCEMRKTAKAFQMTSNTLMCSLTEALAFKELVSVYLSMNPSTFLKTYGI